MNFIEANGARIPAIGLGTWELRGRTCARLVEQALVTLLSNAVAHSPTGELIEVNATREDNAVVFSVADHGPGLAAGEESKVFEKFYRGPGTAPGGLGLGLSIARQLIEAHSGEIIAQRKVPVLPDDTPESLHTRIQTAERELYPEVIGRFCGL